MYLHSPLVQKDTHAPLLQHPWGGKLDNQLNHNLLQVGVSAIEQLAHILVPVLLGILSLHIRDLLLWFHIAEFGLQSHMAGVGVTG